MSVYERSFCVDELVSSDEIVDRGGGLRFKVSMRKEQSEERDDDWRNARARQRNPAGESNNVRCRGQCEGIHPAAIGYSKLRRSGPRINSQSYLSQFYILDLIPPY